MVSGRTILIFVCVFLISVSALRSQEHCKVKNEFFQSGESITYKIFYHWSFIWVAAGEVTFSVDTTHYKGKPAYHFQSVGATYPKYDWIYKVKDKYESFSDTNSLSPFYFMRDVKEGSTKFYNQYDFDQQAHNAIVLLRNKKGEEEVDTIHIDECSFDPLSMIYFARCIDFSKYEVDDKIPLNIILDKEVHHIYIRYLGKEKLKVKGKGKFNTIKFSPLLVKGSIFNGGEGMVVWVSDDKNKIPLRIETKILVGSINVMMKETTGLKFPIEAKIDE